MYSGESYTYDGFGSLINMTPADRVNQVSSWHQLELRERPLMRGIGSWIDGINLHLFLDFTSAYGPAVCGALPILKHDEDLI